MHTPTQHMLPPKDDDNRAPHMLAYVFLAGCLFYAAGIATVCLMVAGL